MIELIRRIWRWLTEIPVDEDGNEIPILKITITEEGPWDD